MLPVIPSLPPPHEDESGALSWSTPAERLKERTKGEAAKDKPFKVLSLAT